MKPTIIVLADYANVEQHGKLNIMGIFGAIHAQTFPTIHPQMHLVISLKTELGDRSGKKTLAVQMTDEDGKVLLELTGVVEIAKPRGGQQAQLNYIFGLQMIKFEKPGGYTFSVLIDNEPCGRVDLEVQKITQQRG